MLIKQSLSVSSPPTRHKAIFKSALHSKKSAASNGLSEDFEGRPFFLPLTLVTPRCAHLGHISFFCLEMQVKNKIVYGFDLKRCFMQFTDHVPNFLSLDLKPLNDTMIQGFEDFFALLDNVGG